MPVSRIVSEIFSVK